MQSTFLHSTIGLSILPDDQRYVARIGTIVGTGVEVDPDSLFKLTAALYITYLTDLMKVDDKKRFNAVSANTVKIKKKVQF